MKSRARRVYLQAVLLNALAQGAWRATYSWYLLVYLRLGAAQMALVLGMQFVLQIVLEIPTGTWADREDTGNLLKLANLGYLGCALAYIATGCLHLDRSTGSPIADFAVSHNALISVLTIVGAGAGELFFGIATAFSSGTLDAWLMEKERSAAGEDADDFARRVDWSKSVKYLTGLATTVVGVLVALLALKGGRWSLAPWALAACVYLFSMVWIRRQIQNVSGASVPLSTTLRNILPWKERSLALVARHSRRAFAYLHESGSLFWLIAQSSFAYVLFWSVQAFWLAFPIAILGWDDSLTRVIPAWALMWAAGESALSIGGWLAGKRLHPDVEPPNSRAGAASAVSRAQLVGWSIVFAAGLGVMLMSVAQGSRRFLVFGFGYTCCRFAEGAVRKLLDAALERAVLSERATHQSIDSFVKSVVGIIFMAGVGYVFDLDPVNGVLLLLACAVAVVLIFALCPIGGSAAAPEQDRVKTAPANALSGGLLFAVVALVGVFFFSQIEVAGRAWSWLRGVPPVTISYGGQEALEQPRSVGGVPIETVSGRVWDLAWTGGAGSAWRCEIVSFDLLKLAGTVVNGVDGVAIHATPAAQALSFAGGSREPRVIAATELLRPFRCWPLDLHTPLTLLASAPLALRFDNQLDFHSGSRSALLLELFAAAAIVTGIFVLGHRQAFAVVVDAQQLTPVLGTAVVNSSAPLEETDGLGGIDIDRFKQELNVDRIILGSVRLDDAQRPLGFWGVDFPPQGAPSALSSNAAERVRGFMQATLAGSESSVCGTAPRFSASMRKRSAKTASAAGERKLDFVAWATSARHLVADQGARAERVVGFAIAVCDDEAPRYVDPLDRILLHMLADATCTRYVLFRHRLSSQTRLAPPSAAG